MKKILLLSCALCLALFANAQPANPDWSFPLEGKPTKIFVHNFTGIPIVETSTFYYGVNYIEGNILWKVEKDVLNEKLKNTTQTLDALGVTNNASSQVDESFEEIPFTPFASINDMFVDIETGKILFGADTVTKYSSILETNTIPEIFVLLVKTISGRVIKLHCVDLETRELVWTKVLGKESVLKSISKHTSLSLLGSANAFDPKATSSNDIVYKYNKTLILINSKDGSSIWENECNPGTFFLDDKEEHLMIVEQSGGLLSTASFGKKVMALDLKTGKDLWKKPVEIEGNFRKQIQIDAESVLIAGKDGFNIYKYATGEKLWKKDYEAKNLKDVTVEDEGYEVFYGKKTMLVDNVSGKNIWKKPFEMDLDDEDDDVVKKEYEKGYLLLSAEFARFVDKVKGKLIWYISVDKTAKIAFDERNRKIAILDGKKFYLFNPDEHVKRPEKTKLDIEKSEEIYLFETRDKGYFVQGMNEYFFVDGKGTMQSHKYYKQLATNRMERALLNIGGIVAGVMSTEVTVSGEGGNSSTFGLLTSNTKQYAAGSKSMLDVAKRLKANAKLRNASKTTNDFAYFISGEKKDGQDFLSLVKVDKNTGDEIKSYNMGNNRKIIYELAPNINMAFVIIDGQLTAYNL
ncbi:MAG: PQQ-binding-like beta-propeller repeat protein [Prevotellaceae bacterium]|jgi:outer membrane protein assembly factor BamB|nr:PQQ-binding-like beta-propeller repeat protein [Prevotellaceae bacterium]